MAKWLDIPNWGFSGHTDAQVVDAQAGMEADEITKLSMQLGANLNHDVGYMDFGLSGSLAEVVLVAEFIARDRRLLTAIEVSRRDAGRGRAQGRRPRRRLPRPAAHAAQPARQPVARPAAEPRELRPLGEGGALDATEKARQRARELLATHEVAPLPDGLAAQLDAVVPAG